MSIDFKELLDKYKTAYDKMTDSQKLRMWYEQRRSFAKGMCPDSRDYPEFCANVDARMPSQSKLTDAEIGLILVGQYHVK